MPFFPASYLSSEPTLFQLLSALDESNDAPAQKQCSPRRQYHRQQTQTFTPRFDVAETETAYELFGEVPGLAQEDVAIEFSDAQTIVIKGKTQRAEVVVKGKEISQETQQEPESEKSDAASTSSHHATVEDDEYDQADVPVSTPATSTTATVAASEPQQPQAQAQPPTPQPKAKYWVSERRVGEFARSFSFAQRIDQDAVAAELRNGVLHVRVPKNLKRGKVLVSVH